MVVWSLRVSSCAACHPHVVVFLAPFQLATIPFPMSRFTAVKAGVPAFALTCGVVVAVAVFTTSFATFVVVLSFSFAFSFVTFVVSFSTFVTTFPFAFALTRSTSMGEGPSEADPLRRTSKSLLAAHCT